MSRSRTCRLWVMMSEWNFTREIQTSSSLENEKRAFPDIGSEVDSHGLDRIEPTGANGPNLKFEDAHWSPRERTFVRTAEWLSHASAVIVLMHQRPTVHYPSILITQAGLLRIIRYRPLATISSG